MCDIIDSVMDITMGVGTSLTSCVGDILSVYFVSYREIANQEIGVPEIADPEIGVHEVSD